MPIFILLYTALISPQFIEIAGNSSFFFISRLDAPIRSHAGEAGDQRFGVAKGDTFSSGKYVTVYTKEGVIKDVKVEDPNKIFINKDQKQEVIPGEALSLQVNLYKLDLPDGKLSEVQKIDIPVINNSTKEIEHITFNKTDSSLAAKIETEGVKTTFNYDVLALILLFGITMFLSQKVMTTQSSATAMDPSQKAMQDQMGKIMPVMITSMFIFFPIPAGVLLYMVVSNIIQVIQTVMINKSIEKEKVSKSKTIVDEIPSEVKTVTGKEVSEDETASQPQISGPKKKKRKK